MKYLIAFILFLCNISMFAQDDVVSKLLHSSEANVTFFMKEHLPLYILQKDTVKHDIDEIKSLEFVLSADSVQTGILVYLFYYENPYIDSCTSMRLIFYDEDKFRYAVKMLTSRLKKLSIYQWYDSKNDLKISTYFAKSDNAEISFYFMDIDPYDH